MHGLTISHETFLITRSVDVHGADAISERHFGNASPLGWPSNGLHGVSSCLLTCGCFHCFVLHQCLNRHSDIFNVSEHEQTATHGIGCTAGLGGKSRPFFWHLLGTPAGAWRRVWREHMEKWVFRVAWVRTRGQRWWVISKKVVPIRNNFTFGHPQLREKKNTTTHAVPGSLPGPPRTPKRKSTPKEHKKTEQQMRKIPKNTKNRCSP